MCVTKIHSLRRLSDEPRRSRKNVQYALYDGDMNDGM